MIAANNNHGAAVTSKTGHGVFSCGEELFADLNVKEEMQDTEATQPAPRSGLAQFHFNMLARQLAQALGNQFITAAM